METEMDEREAEREKQTRTLRHVANLAIEEFSAGGEKKEAAYLGYALAALAGLRALWGFEPDARRRLSLKEVGQQEGEQPARPFQYVVVPPGTKPDLGKRIR